LLTFVYKNGTLRLPETIYVVPSESPSTALRSISRPPGGHVYASADAGDTGTSIVRDLPAVLSVEVQTIS
jgi:hypothetical protein